MTPNEIYLDNSATTPLCDEARDAWLSAVENFGNPSSLHARGSAAARALEEARRTIATSLGLRNGDLIFTASGSEANNIAILGRAYAKARFRERHAKIISTAGEHASVRLPLERLREDGFDLHLLPTPKGAIDLGALAGILDRNTALVTVMHTNNETGAVHDVAAIARLVRKMAPDALIHCDATQGALHGCRDLSTLGVDMITFSAHKLEGPHGIGALWIGRDLIKRGAIAPIILGGGQESGLRSGTSDLPSAAAFAAAVTRAAGAYASEIAQISSLREYLLSKLSGDEALAEARANIPIKAAPHIISITLPSIKSETMLNHLSARGIYISSGSACSSHKREPSAALSSFGLTAREADTTIRVSLGRRNTAADIDAFCEALADGIRTLVRF